MLIDDHFFMEISDQFVLKHKKVGRGLMRNKDIGGDYIYTFMWQFQEPLRRDDNTHVSYANKFWDSTKKTRKYRQIWQGAKPRMHRKY